MKTANRNVHSPRVTIVIPQWNSTALTVRCLESLRRHEREPFRVTIVDDGSDVEERQTVERLKSEQVSILRQTWSGVTAAWNRGAQSVPTRFVLFLNNDTVVDGPILARLIEPLEQGEAVLAGVAFRRERMLPPEFLAKLPTDRFLEGWCLAVATELLERVGWFDESLRLYWSDTDLQLRLLQGGQAVAGRLLAIVDLPIRHDGHRTAHRLKNRRELWRRDRDVFVKKWLGR